MKTLYRVRLRLLGADRPANLYFATEKEAQEFADTTDYTDNPMKCNMSDLSAERALDTTDALLNWEV